MATKEPLVLRRFITHVLSFGVSVGLGLAPFLGQKKVPGFRALLDLFPFQLQEVLIPIAAFLMGLVALAVQFYATEKVTRALLKGWFNFTWKGMLAALMILFVIYYLVVERVEVLSGRRTVAVLRGVSQAPLDTCACRKPPLMLGNKACIKYLAFNDDAIEACFGEFKVKLGPVPARRESSARS